MKRVGAGNSGYTVVETLIFLAVSGTLFISAMLLINGQQRKTQFATAVRDFDSKLRTVMGNVTSGYYNNTGSVVCNVNATGVITSFSNGATPLGQNSNCTYIGQVFIPTTTRNGVTFYSVAGSRLNNATKQETKNLFEAQPKLIGLLPEVYNFPAGITIVSNATVPYGMKVGASAFGAFGVFTSFNQYSGAVPQLNSGSTVSNNFALTSTDFSTVESELRNVSTPTPTNQNIQICLTDGDQVGVIVLTPGSSNITIGKTCP